MISRFNQLLLAFTTVTPLLLSIAVVSVCLYPSGYGCAWSDLVCFGTIPMSIYWWIPTVFISMFMASWIWTGWLLKQIMKERRGELSITLSSLQNTSSNNLLPVIAMLPPWVTLLQRDQAELVLIVTVLLSIAIAYYVSRQGYISLIFLMCGYKFYEGVNKNGMKLQLLSKRTWRNHKDISRIVMLSDNFALVL